MRSIDIEFIKKYVDITEEELMMRLVKDALGLQQEAEANKKEQERQERLNDPEYRKLLLKFWNQVPYLQKYFTDDEIVHAAACFMSKNSVTTEMYRRGYYDGPKETPYSIFLRHGTHEFTEERGSWSRKVTDRASVFLVANQYQGVSGGHDAVKQLLFEKLPYLKKYNPSVYDISDSNDWIYIPIEYTDEDGNTNPHYLYCPVSALMKKNPNKIVKTHRNYWNRYGCGKYDAKENAFLESEGVQVFLKEVSA